MGQTFDGAVRKRSDCNYLVKLQVNRLRIIDRARMNDIDVPVALVALSENRSRIWLSLLLSFGP
jgi:hypothetical protein